MSEYMIHEHMSYDWMIAAYFFLGGLSAGSYIFSVVANYWKKEFQPLAKAAGIFAPLILAMGMLILLLDLGQPLRFLGLFLRFVPTSALSWGVWFLNIFLILSVLYVWNLIKGRDETAKKFAYWGLPFSVLVATYTAMLLGQAPGRVLWHSALLPPLFLLGSLISGIALAMLISFAKGQNLLTVKLGRFLAYLLILEVGLVLVELINLANGGREAMAMARHLVTGEYGFLFWTVEIALGSIIPIAILLKNKISSSTHAFASLLILMGMFMMRYIIVIGGQVPTF
jgi:formate-dependent nitrite reductase membrane component NrfD